MKQILNIKIEQYKATNKVDSTTFTNIYLICQQFYLKYQNLDKEDIVDAVLYLTNVQSQLYSHCKTRPLVDDFIQKQFLPLFVNTNTYSMLCEDFVEQYMKQLQVNYTQENVKKAFLQVQTKFPGQKAKDVFVTQFNECINSGYPFFIQYSECNLIENYEEMKKVCQQVFLNQIRVNTIFNNIF